MGVPNTMLHSTWDALEVHDPEERPWSVIAAPEGKSLNGRFSLGLVAMKNLEIRVHLNLEKMYPTTSAANLHHVARVVIQDCQFCLDENVGDALLGKHLVENPCQTVGFHDSTHLSRIGMLVAQHNRTILATSQGNLFGNRPAPVNVQIDLIDFEGGQTLHIPPWISHLKYGIYDPDNRLHGSVVWHEPWAAKVFPVEGAKNFSIRRFGE